MSVLRWWSEFPSRWSRDGVVSLKSALLDRFDTAESFRGPNVPKSYGFSLSKADKLSIHSSAWKESNEIHSSHSKEIWKHFTTLLPTTPCLSFNPLPSFFLSLCSPSLSLPCLWFMACSIGIFIIKRTWHSTSSLSGNVDGCGRNFTLGRHS